MTNLSALLLGIIQGLTEFLPVSSSGHLVLTQLILDISPPPYLFDIFVHLASLIAVIIFFRHSILKLSIDYFYKLALATLPILLVGFLIRNHVDQIFAIAPIVSLGLLITGFFNLYTHQQLSHAEEALDLKDASPQSPNAIQALTIGLFQSLAIIPGISRSGTTFFAATLCQLPTTEAFRFSFLLSIPIILVVNLHQILFSSLALSTISLTQLMIGGTASLVVALLSLKLLKRLVKNRFYLIFAIYCLIMALVSWFAL